MHPFRGVHKLDDVHYLHQMSLCICASVVIKLTMKMRWWIYVMGYEEHVKWYATGELHLEYNGIGGKLLGYRTVHLTNIRLKDELKIL